MTEGKRKRKNRCLLSTFESEKRPSRFQSSTTKMFWHLPARDSDRPFLGLDRHESRPSLPLRTSCIGGSPTQPSARFKEPIRLANRSTDSDFFGPLKTKFPRDKSIAENDFWKQLWHLLRLPHLHRHPRPRLRRIRCSTQCVASR